MFGKPISNNARFVMEQGRKVGNIKKIRPPKSSDGGLKGNGSVKKTAPSGPKTSLSNPAMQPANRKQSPGKVGTFNTDPYKA